MINKNKSNYFINSVKKYNNFEISYKESIQYLNKILNTCTYSNIMSYDFINYEKIFYIEYIYSKDEEIQYLIKKVKKQISENYKYKQQLLNKLILKTNN